MKQQTERKRLFDEAMSLLREAGEILLRARAKHEKRVAELEATAFKKAA